MILQLVYLYMDLAIVIYIVLTHLEVVYNWFELYLIKFKYLLFHFCTNNKSIILILREIGFYGYIHFH